MDTPTFRSREDVICKIPLKISKRLDKFYTNAKENPNVSTILKIIEQHEGFEVQIIKNATLANMYKLQIKKQIF